MSLYVHPVELREANAFVERLHRHHKPVQGHRWSIGCSDTELRGVAVVGRPVARMTDQRKVLEITRLCTDGTKNACSILYAAAARVGREMGYSKIQTFILDTETGTSLKAAGYALESWSDGGDWNCSVRKGRRTDQPQTGKNKWSKQLNATPTGANP